MKHIFTFLFCLVAIVACKKTEFDSSKYYMQTVQEDLKDSISLADYELLDFSKSILSKVDSVSLYMLKVPFKQKSIANDFVLLQTDKEGHVQQGRIVHLDGGISKDGLSQHRFDGNILIQSLRRQKLIESQIQNGFITAFHEQMPSASLVQPGNVMPEVIITYVIQNNRGISLSTWMWLQSLFSGNDVQPYYSFFNNDAGSSPWSGGGGSGSGNTTGGGGGSSGGGRPINDPPLLIDFENQDLKGGIDLQKFINCFNAIPDVGATCSIEIFSDIPVDDNPNAFYDFSTGSPGHVFIQIKKVNGAQSASQNIGFYPRSGYKASTYASTASKLVDNSGHEFNAALFMSLTPAQLSSILIRIQQLANVNYDIDQYNCTDWALNIFNHTRANQLEIPLFGIPGSPMTQATRTPQGLYHKLQQMSNANDPEKGNITIGIIKGYAGGSTGPCN